MSDATWSFAELLDEISKRYASESLDDYWAAEKPGIEIALRSIAGHLPTRYQPIKVLGVGGSGIVLRLKDGLFPKHDKAIKFPRPVPGKIELVAEMLTKEIAFLSDLQHPGIVRILDYATLEEIPQYTRLPYYIMDFVDGTPSRQFVAASTTQDSQFRTLVRLSVETLAYLHTIPPKGGAHLDVKPENIMVTASGRPIVIDLGTCKRLDADDGKTIVACTKSFADPRLVRRLAKDPSDENRSKGELARSEIEPTWDLWAFALTLLSWLGIDPEDGKSRPNSVHSRLSPYSRKYYMLLIARLLSYSLPLWLEKRVGLSSDFLKDIPIASSTELCGIVARLESTGDLSVEIPELQRMSSGTFQAARGTNVVHTPALDSVLEHRLYRRLNSITQLGMVSQIYRRAKHTRSEHSLGTYANCGRILRALYDDTFSPLFRQIISAEDCRTVLLAALVHDLGQFPLGHELEEIDDRVFNHTDLTRAMLRGEWTRKKKGSKRIAFESLDDTFSIWNVTPDRLEAILSAKPTSTSASRKDKLLRSILSGPIDADKLDYLPRDAHHTDVPYPLGIDVEMLFRCLTTTVINRVEGGAQHVPAIAIHSKGKVAAEFLTLARYAMFSQVYWHHAVRAQKAMFFRAVMALLSELSTEAALEQFRSDFVTMVSELPESLYREDRVPDLFTASADPQDENDENPNNVGSSRITVSAFRTGTDLMPTDAAVLSWFHQRLRDAERPEGVLIEGILKRKLFKRLWVLNFEMEPTRWKKIVELWDQLDRGKRHFVAREFEKAISTLLSPERTASVTQMKSSDAREQIAEWTAGEIPWLLVDIPGSRPGSEVGLYYVLEGQRRQLRKDDRAVGTPQSSSVWERYARDLRQVAGKIRIFCDEALVDTVEASIEWADGIGELEDALVRVLS